MERDRVSEIIKLPLRNRGMTVEEYQLKMLTVGLILNLENLTLGYF